MTKQMSGQKHSVPLLDKCLEHLLSSTSPGANRESGIFRYKTHQPSWTCAPPLLPWQAEPTGSQAEDCAYQNWLLPVGENFPKQILDTELGDQNQALDILGVDLGTGVLSLPAAALTGKPPDPDSLFWPCRGKAEVAQVSGMLFSRSRNVLNVKLHCRFFSSCQHAYVTFQLPWMALWKTAPKLTKLYQTNNHDTPNHVLT